MNSSAQRGFGPARRAGPGPGSAPRDRSEEREQARLIRWSHRPDVRAWGPLAWLHHSPNGGQRSGFTGAQIKALGCKPGFPDLILPVPSPDARYTGLAIEMKAPTGRTTPEQDAWLDRLARSGWATAVARSAADARLVLCRYLDLDPARVPQLE